MPILWVCEVCLATSCCYSGNKADATGTSSYIALCIVTQKIINIYTRLNCKLIVLFSFSLEHELVLFFISVPTRVLYADTEYKYKYREKLFRVFGTGEYLELFRFNLIPCHCLSLPFHPCKVELIIFIILITSWFLVSSL